MRVGSVTLKIALHDAAPVDQLFWPVWGFCVLEAASGGELVLEGAAPALMDALATMSGACGVAVAAGEGSELDPSRPFAAVSSAGVVSSALLRHAREDCVFPAGPLETVAAEWFWDAGWMVGFRARVQAAACSVLGDESGAAVDQALQRIVPWQPTVSLVSSVFKADRFLAHFLENSAGWILPYREPLAALEVLDQLSAEPARCRAAGAAAQARARALFDMPGYERLISALYQRVMKISE